MGERKTGKAGCYNIKREIGRYLQKGQTRRGKEREKLDRCTQTREDDIIMQNLIIKFYKCFYF